MCDSKVVDDGQGNTRPDPDKAGQPDVVHFCDVPLSAETLARFLDRSLDEEIDLEETERTGVVASVTPAAEGGEAQAVHFGSVPISGASLDALLSAARPLDLAETRRTGVVTAVRPAAQGRTPSGKPEELKK